MTIDLDPADLAPAGLMEKRRWPVVPRSEEKRSE